MKKFSFDVSWKGIVLTIIILAFLMGVIDTIVDAEEVPTSKYETTVCDRMLRFQKIEDRELAISKEEDEDFRNDWIKIYDAKPINNSETMYYYRYYDGYGDELRDDSVILSNEMIDTCYHLTVYIHDDELWGKTISSVCNKYAIK